MFSFFKDKSAGKGATTVHSSVGATLKHEAAFPAVTDTDSLACKLRALDGIPPNASLVDTAVPGQTTSAYVIDRDSQPALALVNISGERAHIELWELAPGKQTFARRRTVRLDPQQDTWSAYLLADVACLPGDRLLLAVFYYAPQVKQALFVYDMTGDTYAKIANVVPFTDNRQKFFEAKPVAPGTAAIMYYTGRERLAPEIYYNAPSHVRLMGTRELQGTEVLSLGAADGSIRRWAVIDNSLWLDTMDFRNRNKPTEFFWSLDLAAVLAR